MCNQLLRLLEKAQFIGVGEKFTTLFVGFKPATLSVFFLWDLRKIFESAYGGVPARRCCLK